MGLIFVLPASKMRLQVINGYRFDTAQKSQRSCSNLDKSLSFGSVRKNNLFSIAVQAQKLRWWCPQRERDSCHSLPLWQERENWGTLPSLKPPVLHFGGILEDLAWQLLPQLPFVSYWFYKLHARASGPYSCKREEACFKTEAIGFPSRQILSSECIHAILYQCWENLGK